ncbi:hypothetical protein YC2023_075767 [Brassica napus]
MMSPHGTIRNLNTILFASRDNLIELSYVHSHGLLQKDVLSTLGSTYSPLDMEASWERNVKSINLWIF